MTAKTKDFSEKQVLFIHYYVITKNATEAAIRAGYSKKTAGSAGSRMLKLVKVKEEIDKRLGKLKATLEITAENVLREMARLAFYDPGNLYDDDGKLIPIKDLDEDTRRAIKGWDVERNESSYIDGKGDTYRVDTKTTIKPRMADKRPLLRDLGQHLDIFESEDEDKKRPINVTVNIGGEE